MALRSHDGIYRISRQNHSHWLRNRRIGKKYHSSSFAHRFTSRFFFVVSINENLTLKLSKFFFESAASGLFSDSEEYLKKRELRYFQFMRNDMGSLLSMYRRWWFRLNCGWTPLTTLTTWWSVHRLSVVNHISHFINIVFYFGFCLFSSMVFFHYTYVSLFNTLPIG